MPWKKSHFDQIPKIGNRGISWQKMARIFFVVVLKFVLKIKPLYAPLSEPYRLHENHRLLPLKSVISKYKRENVRQFSTGKAASEREIEV